MKISAIVCSLVLAAALSPRAAAAEAMSPDAARRVADATVLVNVVYQEGQYAELTSGSGILVAPGVVLTNAHIVNEKVPIRIHIQNERLPPTPASVAALRYDGNEFTPAEVVRHIASALIFRTGMTGVRLSRRQTNFDMAILTFTPPPGVQPPGLVFALQTTPGERVVASGYPDRGEGRPAAYASAAPAASLSSGSVTGLIDRDPLIIVHSALCANGNSGGPLANARGEAAGMQTWTSVPGKDGGYMSMAVGSRDLVAFLQANGVTPLVSGAAPPPPLPEERQDGAAYVLGLADAGDAHFQALAGLLFHLGDCGFPRDDDRAVRYLEQALRTSPDSPYRYLHQAGLAAVLLQSRRVGQPDYALSLLREANNSGVVDSHSAHPDLKLLAFEASLCLKGDAAGVRYDPERARVLAERAMEGGFALPYAILGYLYYFGDASAGRDHATALRFAREAARNGIPEGLSLLAHLYYQSDVVAATPANRLAARRLAEEAARLGDVWAGALLAKMQ